MAVRMLSSWWWWCRNRLPRTLFSADRLLSLGRCGRLGQVRRGFSIASIFSILVQAPGTRHQNQCFAVGDVLHAWHHCLNRYQVRFTYGEKKKGYEAQRGWPQIHHLVYMKREQHIISRSPPVKTTGIISHHQKPSSRCAQGPRKFAGSSN